jgi:signal transduction histidine kinase
VLASAKGLIFSQSVVPSNHALLANEAALKRLFMTVLDNAIKYTPAAGHVSLVFRMKDSQALIEIVDSGIGITEKDLPHVFERFYRADQARSRETRGSGLGLSIAKWIAESHNGSIELRSQPGHGTKVMIRLPLLTETTNKAYTQSEFQAMPV